MQKPDLPCIGQAGVLNSCPNACLGTFFHPPVVSARTLLEHPTDAGQLLVRTLHNATGLLFIFPNDLVLHV